MPLMHNGRAAPHRESLLLEQALRLDLRVGGVLGQGEEGGVQGAVWI